MTNSTSSAPTLPCVVQVGFAGSRRLFAEPPTDPSVQRQWHDAVTQHVVKSLDELPGKLQLSSQHFLCGISQIACGADTLFTRACRERRVPHRIFLPQPVADYLAASGSGGTPDFTPTQRSEAESLLASDHIIQQRIVSHALDRHDRFRETNAEILRVSDVMVCLLRDDSKGEAGGTNELLRRAQASHTPVLAIRVAVKDGQPDCRNEWHIPADYEQRRPSIPEPLDELALPDWEGPIPSIQEYCLPLKDRVSTKARTQQRLFRYAAAGIIATHILATMFATGARAMHGHGEQIILWLLGTELVLLLSGFVVHHYLDHAKAARVWAHARVVAELARSISAIHPRHVYLEHLFRLPLPHRFRDLLRTLNVLYLRSTYGKQQDPWSGQRDKYVRDRIDHQIDYYPKRLVEDEFRQKVCQGIFTFCSVSAMAATLVKLALLVAAVSSGRDVALWPQVLGTLAIILPVLAVGGLSWSAALDCEARIETFRETLAFLKRQQELLPQADTAAEFDRLVLETETVLLGEVANWFSRRANKSVT